MADLDTRPILTYRFTQTVFHGALMAHRRHIDEVDNNQTTEVAQTQLTGNLVGGFQVGVEGGLFDIATACRAGGVDIDGGQRFGAVDNDRTAGRQTHFALERRFNLRFDLVMAEQRNFTGVQFDFAAEVRTTERGDVLTRQLQHFRVIDKDFTDILTQVVAEGAHNHVTFLMNQERCRAAVCGFFDGFPVLQTEAEVPLQRFGRFADASGTHDQAHAVRQLQR